MSQNKLQENLKDLSEEERHKKESYKKENTKEAGPKEEDPREEYLSGIDLLLMAIYPLFPILIVFFVNALSCTHSLVRGLLMYLPIICLICYVLSVVRLVSLRRAIVDVVTYTAYVLIVGVGSYFIVLMKVIPLCVM